MGGGDRGKIAVGIDKEWAESAIYLEIFQHFRSDICKKESGGKFVYSINFEDFLGDMPVSVSADAHKFYSGIARPGGQVGKKPVVDSWFRIRRAPEIQKNIITIQLWDEVLIALSGDGDGRSLFADFKSMATGGNRRREEKRQYRDDDKILDFHVTKNSLHNSRPHLS